MMMMMMMMMMRMRMRMMMTTSALVEGIDVHDGVYYDSLSNANV